VSRSEQKRQQGRELALQAYRLWRACDRLDQADDEVSFTRYYLQNLYSYCTAARFARRKSEITPRVGPSQIRLIKHEGVRWWLAAAEDQRVGWLRWMLPRYLGARNRPYHPVKTTRLPVLLPDSRAYDWVEAILNIGMLGGTGRRVMIGNEPPANHILNGPEWRVLSGQRVLSLEVNRARQLVENYLSSSEAKLI
jgi:hypothetical protein